MAKACDLVIFVVARRVSVHMRYAAEPRNCWICTANAVFVTVLAEDAYGLSATAKIPTSQLWRVRGRPPIADRRDQGWGFLRRGIWGDRDAIRAH
jgi:hypothetical protein